MNKRRKALEKARSFAPWVGIYADKAHWEEVKFVVNPHNIGNCGECPHNNGSSSERGGAYICGPCGQQVCFIEQNCGEFY